MASTSFGARSRAVSHAGTQPLEPHHKDRTHSNNSAFSSDSITLHSHRQNHNSSKLPAFRFADLRKDRISLPSLQQRTPLSPILSQTTAEPLDHHQTAQEQTHCNSGSSQNGLHHHSSARTLTGRSVSFETPQKTGEGSRTRSLKFHLPSTTTAVSADTTASKRPASFPPETHKAIDKSSATRSRFSYDAIPVLKRRLTESAAKDSARGQQEPLLPEATETTKSDDNKSRPSLSYTLSDSAVTASTSGGRMVIPPIRSFRSSGSRKTVVIDAHARRKSEDSINKENADSKQRDRALQALEGRKDEEPLHADPSESGEMTATTDNDNTADIFMKIAREEPAPRASEKQTTTTDSVISRIVRTSHRRPLSAAVPSQDGPQAPPISRRLSDQQENSRARQGSVSQPAQQITRELAYRATARENLPPITTTAESSSRAQPGRSSLRPSPITPRQISFKDSFAESTSAYQRRRQSLTESNNNLSGSRATQYRSSNLAMTQSRTYHSSPLAPKFANAPTDGSHNHSDANHGVEGTDSSSSAAAPSTVWDELDDLKSRIHRLELTGKAPFTTGVPTFRSSDERPRTATTNATTVSASPKQASGTGSAQANGNSNPPLTRETLLAALSKTKDLVHPEVFSAIESAATDAMALSSMIGAPGQPGPISSGASSIGGYSGSVTDRQLRKKADSICRSLTELCLALTEHNGQRKQPQQQLSTAAPEQELLLSPSSNKATTGALTPQRRPSAIAGIMAKASTSPRAPTALEQKRKTMLASISVPTSRYATAPSTPLEPSAGRKSSLLLARIRRTATEEAEEAAPQAGRRSSLLLRTRRTGEEELGENREGQKTSLLLRTRKTMSEEDESPRSRVPSRAVTEVNGFRPAPRELAITSMTAQRAPENNMATHSAVPRRAIPSAISTRLTTIVPATSTPTTPARKYLERGTLQDRGLPQERSTDRGSYLERGTHQERVSVSNASERLAEERVQQQRQVSLSQTAMLNRTGSLGRRARESGIPSLRS
ncbi:hypothetical protein C8A03DRAFT_11231 [Achaetomium macrosporum]|uniref:LPXTG-motif cell wall anchor domain protein n=1 Tax=Achaetomium macrosporum TaxID=79813 RepID=A0AAN7CJX1_9PEZI|nr:hypothetical protein C8A03DRAFT_11231 [Achaetomium macrosporum]